MTIDRGRRNQEILKQGQFAPVPVEEQVAIIYASTKGLMDSVPVDKAREFETEFLTVLRNSHADALNLLKAGKLDDAAIDALVKVAKEVSSKY